MAQVYSQEVRDNIVKLREDGLTYPQIAETLGIQYSSSLWRICATDGKTKGHFVTDDEKDTVIRMFKDGASRHEIADAIGRSYSFVAAFLDKCGYSLKETNEELYAMMREYKAQGHSIKEVESRFGVRASSICKGIAPQKTDYAKVSKSLKEHYAKGGKSFKDQERKLIELLCDKFEYVCGYDGRDGYVTIRCKDCGAEFERSVQAIRKHQATNCPECRKRQTEANKEQRDKERNIKQEQQLKEREEKRKLKEQELKRKDQERIEKTVDRVCRVCGKTFKTWQNKKCCSAECSQKYADSKRDYRIPMNKRISVGITAKSLYKRDNGTCWICGGKCDLNDYVTRNGVFIAGDWYPSVDHIVPIVDGGEHSWENVKLAHRICNSRRYYAEKSTLRS